MDKLSRLDWSDLRVLLLIQDYGGASNAGAALGLSHQTVSRRLSRLEDVLGLRLVNRERHPWILTKKGKSVCAYAARMNAVSRDVARYVQSEQRDMVTRVSIASNALGFDLLVLPVLQDLRHSFPDLGFDLIAGDDPLDVQSGNADLALRVVDMPPLDLLGRKVGQLAMGVYGRVQLIDHLDADRTQNITIVRLHGQPQHGEIWPVKDEMFQRTITVNDFATLVNAVRHGMGVAVLPHVIGRVSADLACSRTISLDATRSVWLLRNKDSRGSAVIGRIEDEILQFGQRLLAAS